MTLFDFLIKCPSFSPGVGIKLLEVSRSLTDCLEECGKDLSQEDRVFVRAYAMSCKAAAKAGGVHQGLAIEMLRQIVQGPDRVMATIEEAGRGDA